METDPTQPITAPADSATSTNHTEPAPDSNAAPRPWPAVGPDPAAGPDVARTVTLTLRAVEEIDQRLATIAIELGIVVALSLITLALLTLHGRKQTAG